jgi:type IV pilus assembly protein PilC
MEKYKYRAVNASGRPVRGLLTAANEVDLFNQLQSAGLELVTCQRASKKSGGISLGLKSVKVRELIQFFMQLDQMQSAGIALLDALADIRDTSDNDYLRDVMTEVYRDVSEGSSLSEAMEKHPKVFKPLYISLVSSGEKTGDMPAAYQQLVKYLKWVDDMQTKVRKATRYPIILLIAVLAVVVVMMVHVVPQIVGFIRNLDQELPWPTTSLMVTSDFFVAYWWAVIGGIAGVILLIFGLRKVSDGLEYRIDLMLLSAPIAGPLIRKINIARFSQTFASLFASGMDVLAGLKSSQATVTNRALKDSLEGVHKSVQSGMPLSDALNSTGEFPSMVVRMVKVGEESGNLTVVLEQVSEFYTKDVDEAIQGLITMIEPMLTSIMGIVILWIAVGVFGPIYDSFEDIDF